MKPSEIFDMHRETLEIYLASWRLNNYFQKMVVAREENNERELAHLAHKAWEMLPDRRAIHSNGFAQLCDMAEQYFV